MLCGQACRKDHSPLKHTCTKMNIQKCCINPSQIMDCHSATWFVAMGCQYRHTFHFLTAPWWKMLWCVFKIMIHVQFVMTTISSRHVPKMTMIFMWPESKLVHWNEVNEKVQLWCFRHAMPYIAVDWLSIDQLWCACLQHSQHLSAAWLFNTPNIKPCLCRWLVSVTSHQS